MKQISSSANSTIKFIRTLRSRKGRKQSGKFFIEGIRQVGEAVENSFPIEMIIYSPDLLGAEYGKEIIERIDSKKVELIEVTEDVFRSFSMKDGPHGIAAVGVQKYMPIDQARILGMWIALEEVQDPGNLGSILRSLDGADGKGLILVGNTTDPYHPTAVRSSMGAAFTMPIVNTTQEEFLGFKESDGFYSIGAVCEPAPSYKSQQYKDDIVLVMGSEQKGISEVLRKSCDQLVTIPMGGRMDSLNLANAASILMFEIYTSKIDL